MTITFTHIFPQVRAWLILLFLLSMATLLSFLLGPYVSFTSQAMLFVLVVTIAAYQLDRLQSVAGAVVSVLLLNFFLCRPPGLFMLNSLSI